MRALMGLLSVWAFALALSTQPAQLAVVAAAALLAVAVAGHLVATQWSTEDRPLGRRAAPVRARVAVPRHVDPDAAGRPRPRAPSVYPSAA